MAEIVNRAQMPSKRTGEIYEIAEYDDGSVTCTCRYGASRGLMAVGDRVCWHVRDYRIKAAGMDLESTLPHHPPVPGEPGLNVNEWVLRFAKVFCPVNYMVDIVTATLRQDDLELEKMEEKAGGRKGLRPKPLPPFRRAVLVELLPVLRTMEDLPDRPSQGPGHDADLFADAFMRQALQVRHIDRPDGSNDDLAWQLHRWNI